MKPQTIVWFDWVFWLGVALAVVSLGINFESLANAGGAGANKTAAAIGGVIGFVVVIGIYVLLWFLISRKGNNVARWIFTVIVALVFAINVIGAPMAMEQVGVASATLDLLRFGLWVLCALLLFLGGSGRWFAKGGKPDSDAFE